MGLNINYAMHYTRELICLAVMFHVLILIACTAPEQKVGLPSDAAITALTVIQYEESSEILLIGYNDGIASRRQGGEWAIEAMDTGYVYEYVNSINGIYAATQNGLLLSADLGNTWNPIASGQFYNVTSVVASQDASGNDGIFIVATHNTRGRGVFVSFDEGNTWLSGSGGPDSFVSKLKDGTIIGNIDNKIKWAEVLDEERLSWRLVSTVIMVKDIGVMAIKGGSTAEFTALFSDSSDHKLHIYHMMDGHELVNETSFTLAGRPIGCSARGAYGRSGDCYQKPIISETHDASLQALIIAVDGLWLTTDGGGHWRRLPELPQPVHAALVLDNTVHVVTDNTIFELPSGANDWIELDTVPRILQ